MMMKLRLVAAGTLGRHWAVAKLTGATSRAGTRRTF
jgi:hypothetical protein